MKKRISEILADMKKNFEGLETEKTVADASKAEAEKEVVDEEKLIADLGFRWRYTGRD